MFPEEDIDNKRFAFFGTLDEDANLISKDQGTDIQTEFIKRRKETEP